MTGLLRNRWGTTVCCTIRLVCPEWTMVRPTVRSEDLGPDRGRSGLKLINSRLMFESFVFPSLAQRCEIL